MNKSKPGEKLLLRPSEGAKWEAWDAVEGGHPRLAGAYDSPGQAGASPQSVLAIPLRQLFAVPLWLATTDRALMREMIFLQLERRGFAAGRNPRDLIFDYRIVASADNKTLVLAVALPGGFPAHLSIDVRACEPSARLLPLPADAITLWREDGRIALAVTRGGELAYFQVLGDDSLSPAALLELQCVKLQLEAGNVVEHVRGITLWGEFAPAEVAAVGEALGLGAAAAVLPAPVLPSEWMDLTPVLVRRSRQQAKARDRKFAFAAALAGAYMLVLLVLVARTAWYSIEARRLSAGLQEHEGEVAAIQTTASRWNAMSQAIDPDNYALELLRCCSIPRPDDVHFTLFSTDVGTIIIQGEASSRASAYRFVAGLNNSADLRAYQFQMPPPPTLPNGNTKFRIEGTRYGASTH
ncbi:MAG TPA: hypothetical protein VG733_07990 [Chthoniobacteraceae bacterium]|nr:hypothetical protein [Chthoniobacteraceae bacterium]